MAPITFVVVKENASGDTTPIKLTYCGGWVWTTDECNITSEEIMIGGYILSIGVIISILWCCVYPVYAYKQTKQTQYSRQQTKT